MRAIMLGLMLSAAFAALPASAEQRVFIVANNPDGYGVDRCLATGASCGTAIASAYCRSQDFKSALSFHRMTRQEAGGTLPAAMASCTGACEEFVAIECAR